jgi:hypothetical protein
MYHLIFVDMVINTFDLIPSNGSEESWPNLVDWIFVQFLCWNEEFTNRIFISLVNTPTYWICWETLVLFYYFFAVTLCLVQNYQKKNYFFLHEGDISVFNSLPRSGIFFFIIVSQHIINQFCVHFTTNILVWTCFL